MCKGGGYAKNLPAHPTSKRSGKKTVTSPLGNPVIPKEPAVGGNQGKKKGGRKSRGTGEEQPNLPKKGKIVKKEIT